MWTVTRQGQWPTEENVVEVSEGGIDYCNPDALVKKYPGEFETFDDPREAAEVAIEICRLWRKDYIPESERMYSKKWPHVKRDPRYRPKVGAGSTGGWTMPLDACTFKQLRQWAKKTWDELEKCACGKPLPAKKKRWRADDWSGEEFCSEYCAVREIEFQQQQEQEGGDQ